MVPGLMVSLLTGIGAFSASLNIVKEKEIGTIEQINVTPVKKYHFILAKLIPYWVLAMVVFTIGMIISRVAYSIVPVGSIGLLYGFLSVYLLTLSRGRIAYFNLFRYSTTGCFAGFLFCTCF